MRLERRPSWLYRWMMNWEEVLYRYSRWELWDQFSDSTQTLCQTLRALTLSAGAGGSGKRAGPPHEPVQGPTNGGAQGRDLQRGQPIRGGRYPPVPGSSQFSGRLQSCGGEKSDGSSLVCGVFMSCTHFGTCMPHDVTSYGSQAG